MNNDHNPPVVMENVVKRFGGGKSRITAVDDLSLSIRQGEIFGLVGPDGAGKTTTLRMLCTVVRPDSGKITVANRDVVKDPGEIRKKIGYLSQRFSLYSDLTVSENLDFFAEIHGERNYADRKRELLEFMHIDAFSDRLAERLSGGMKQKLALACTLIHHPEIIFLDEPTTGVDPVSRRDFWWIISTLQRDGLTIVIATPYLDEAERCHRVALINKGRIIQLDTPENIRRSLPGQLFEITCSGLRQARDLLLAIPGSEDVQSFGDRLHLRTGEMFDLDGAVRGLRESGLTVFQARRVTPTLEDAFIHCLTGSCTQKE